MLRKESMNHSVLVIILAACSPAWAQTVRPALQPVQYALAPQQHGIVRVVPLALAGEYAGKLGPITIRLHLRVTDQGELAGTLDGGNVTGITVNRFVTDYQKLSFHIPTLPATWTGTVAADGSLIGTWHQGSQNQPLNLSKR